MKPTNKYTYEYIVQGHYAHGWEDVGAHDRRSSAISECKIYRQNDPAMFRVIYRRTLNADYIYNH